MDRGSGKTGTNERRIHLIPGFNVSDYGRQSVQRLTPGLEREGWIVIPRSVPKIGALDFTSRNGALAARMRDSIRPFDTIISHSNGNLIAWQIIQSLSFPVQLAMLNSALCRNTQFRSGTKVLNVMNSDDWALMFARPWSRLLSTLKSGQFHGWGAMGLYGQQPAQAHVTEVDSASGSVGPAAFGHSGVFDEHAPERGRIFGQWANAEFHKQRSTFPEWADRTIEVDVVG